MDKKRVSAQKGGTFWAMLNDYVFPMVIGQCYALYCQLKKVGNLILEMVGWIIQQVDDLHSNPITVEDLKTNMRSEYRNSRKLLKLTDDQTRKMQWSCVVSLEGGGPNILAIIEIWFGQVHLKHVYQVEFKHNNQNPNETRCSPIGPT